jgi:transposase, IS5 family
VTHFGYENHVKVDAKSKLIIAHHTIAAHVHDSQIFRQLVDSSDQRVLADSAYTSAQHEAYLLECNVEEFLMRKGHRGKPLSAAENKSNHTISRIRVRVRARIRPDETHGSRLCAQHRPETSEST